MKKTTEKYGILMDMDGLMLDTEKLYLRFWIEAAEHYGYAMSREQALSMRSLSTEKAKAQIEKMFGPQASYHKIREKRIERMDAWIAANGVEAKEGLIPFLKFLRDGGFPIAVATSSDRENAEKRLTEAGAFRYLDAIVDKKMVSHGKPAPDIYLKAASAIGRKPENCFAFEDSDTGALAAVRAGCRTIVIPDLTFPDPSIVPLLAAVLPSLNSAADYLKKCIDF